LPSHCQNTDDNKTLNETRYFCRYVLTGVEATATLVPVIFCRGRIVTHQLRILVKPLTTSHSTLAKQLLIMFRFLDHIIFGIICQGSMYFLNNCFVATQPSIWNDGEFCIFTALKIRPLGYQEFHFIYKVAKK
jgi:hypothetical protein